MRWERAACAAGFQRFGQRGAKRLQLHLHEATQESSTRKDANSKHLAEGDWVLGRVWRGLDELAAPDDLGVGDAQLLLRRPVVLEHVHADRGILLRILEIAATRLSESRESR